MADKTDTTTNNTASGGTMIGDVPHVAPTKEEEEERMKEAGTEDVEEVIVAPILPDPPTVAPPAVSPTLAASSEVQTQEDATEAATCTEAVTETETATETETETATETATTVASSTSIDVCTIVPPSSAPVSKRVAPKRSRCQVCEACLRDDCGQCSECKKKKRFGGLGDSKQACKERRCTNLQQRPPKEPSVVQKETKLEINSSGGGSSSSSSSKAAKRPRRLTASAQTGGRCFECEPCRRDDCGECMECRKKKCFGGKGNNKQACLLRRCERMASSSVPVQFPQREFSNCTIKVGGRCFNCLPCIRPDCGECAQCKKKKCFGGPGDNKKACIHRKCLNQSQARQGTSQRRGLSPRSALFVTNYPDANGKEWYRPPSSLLGQHRPGSLRNETNRHMNVKAKPVTHMYGIEIPEKVTGVCQHCRQDGQGDPNETILLCDGKGCGREYHLKCCFPPLDRIPRGEFLCFDCSPTGATASLESYLAKHERRKANSTKSSEVFAESLLQSDLLRERRDAEKQGNESKMNWFDSLILYKGLSPQSELEYIHVSCPELFVGKCMRLYCPVDNQYHTGRILQVRQPEVEMAKWESLDEKDITSSQTGPCVWAKDTECLVRFAAGVNYRKTSLTTWVRLEEHSLAVCVDLTWACFRSREATRFHDIGQNLESPTTSSPSKAAPVWMRGKVWRRSSREMVPGLHTTPHGQVMYRSARRGESPAPKRKAPVASTTKRRKLDDAGVIPSAEATVSSSAPSSSEVQATTKKRKLSTREQGSVPPVPTTETAENKAKPKARTSPTGTPQTAAPGLTLTLKPIPSQWCYVESFGTDTIELMCLSIDTRNVPPSMGPQNTQQPLSKAAAIYKFVEAMAKAEEDAQESVRQWNTFSVDNPFHFHIRTLQDEYNLAPLEYRSNHEKENADNKSIQPTPLISTGLDRSYLLKTMTLSQSFHDGKTHEDDVLSPSKDMAFTLRCNLLDEEESSDDVVEEAETSDELEEMSPSLAAVDSTMSSASLPEPPLEEMKPEPIPNEI